MLLERFEMYGAVKADVSTGSWRVSWSLVSFIGFVGGAWLQLIRSDFSPAEIDWLERKRTLSSALENVALLIVI